MTVVFQWIPYICVSTALKPDCVTNFDTFFLVMGVICLVDEMKCKLAIF